MSAEQKVLTLKDYQVPHVERLKEILQTTHCAFDMSMMGTGKTFTTSALSLQCKFNHVIIVCPTTVESRWNQMREYGIPIYDVVSYQSLRSTKGHQPKHGLLERYDNIKDDGGEDLNFKVTPLFEHLTKEGLLLVFDEAQNVKNKSVQAEACKTLASYILSQTERSRFMFLSGSPIDKEEHAINIMQLMGFIRSNRLFVYYKESDRLQLRGAQELVDYCNSVNRELTTEVIKATPFSHKNVRHVCYLLFQKVLKPNITSAMPPPSTNSQIDCKNGYYLMTDPDSTDLMSAIAELDNVARYNPSHGTVNLEGENLGAITSALMAIERPKVSIFVRKTIEELQQNPNCKVGIFVNYKITLQLIAELLVDYNPLILQGNVPKKKREPIIEKFQAPDTKYRVLISNLKVASTGIDLDDKVGTFPRICYASPNYLISDLHQLTRRFLRMDTKSLAKIRFVYGSGGHRETSILNALARKSTVLKETLESQMDHGILFPGEYPEEIERHESQIDTESPSLKALISNSTSTFENPLNTPASSVRGSSREDNLLTHIFSLALQDAGSDPCVEDALQQILTVNSTQEFEVSKIRSNSSDHSDQDVDQATSGRLKTPPWERIPDRNVYDRFKQVPRRTGLPLETHPQKVMSSDRGATLFRGRTATTRTSVVSQGPPPIETPRKRVETSSRSEDMFRGLNPSQGSSSIDPSVNRRKFSSESSSNSKPNMSPTIGINVDTLIRNVRALRVL
jgi:hypothetical protein